MNLLLLLTPLPRLCVWFGHFRAEPLVLRSPDPPVLHSVHESNVDVSTYREANTHGKDEGDSRSLPQARVYEDMLRTHMITYDGAVMHDYAANHPEHGAVNNRVQEA